MSSESRLLSDPTQRKDVYGSFESDAFRDARDDTPDATIQGQPLTGCSWLVSKFKESCTPRATLKAAAAVASSLATVALGAFSAYEYVQHGYAKSTTMLAAAGAGATAIIASQLALPPVVNDSMARWSLEAGQTETQGLMNGLCPLERCSAWNLDSPPESVQFATTSIYYFTASASLGLRLRPLFFKEQSSEDVLPLIDRKKKPNRLFLESSTKLGKQFVIEQVIKAVIAAAVAVPGYVWVHEGPVRKMMIGSGLMLAGSIPASLLTSAYVGYEERVSREAEVPGASQKQLIFLRRAGIVADIVANVGIGAFTSIRSPYAFVPIGFCMGVKKILDQKRFEDLAANPDRVHPFNWKEPSLYAKGLFLLGSMAWYGVGLSDSTNSLNDRLFVSLMYAGALAGYPLQRKVVRNFNPSGDNSIINSAVFYTAYFPIAPYPYMIRRFAGRLADSNPPADTIQAIIDGFAWFTWGFGWSTQRALYGMREDKSPADVTLQQQVWAGRVLTSDAQFDI